MKANVYCHVAYPIIDKRTTSKVLAAFVLLIGRGYLQNRRSIKQLRDISTLESTWLGVHLIGAVT